MVERVSTIPQDLTPVKVLTLETVMGAFPNVIPHLGTYGLQEKICQGKQITNLIVVARQDDPVNNEVKQYFANLIETATNGDFTATVINNWRDPGFVIHWVYDNSEKILRNDLTYIRLPPPTNLPLEITKELFLSRVPNDFPFDEPAGLVGGMTREGRSYNDVDFIVGEPVIVNGEIIGFGEAVYDEQGNVVDIIKVETSRCLQIRNYLNQQMNVGVTAFNYIPVDVGSRAMADREPIYYLPFYRNRQRIFQEE